MMIYNNVLCCSRKRARMEDKLEERLEGLSEQERYKMLKAIAAGKKPSSRR